MICRQRRMLNDLDVIVRTFPKEQNVLHVYAMGDTHVGSEQFDEKTVRKKIEIIRNDPNGVLCLCGDLGDYGLKNSKTNVYKATMQPKEQQAYIYELFEPIKHKIVGAVGGNHEQRIVREIGIDPMLQLCTLWGCPDVYRENVAITKTARHETNTESSLHVLTALTLRFQGTRIHLNIRRMGKYVLIQNTQRLFTFRTRKLLWTQI